MKEIDKSILQKQDLKEKLKTNLLRERSRSQKRDVREIYMPKSKSSNRLRRSNSTSQTRLGKKFDNKCKISEKNCNENNNQVETLLKRRSFSSTRQTQINSKLSNNEIKKLPELSHNKSKVVSKSNSQINFVSANKLNFTKSTKPQESKNHFPPLTKTKTSFSKDFTNSKVRIEPPQNIQNEKSQRNEKCQLHSNDENIKFDRSIKLVDAIEGLDRYGVPSSLVKVLRDYHSYAPKFLSESEIRNKRSEESSNNFLLKFRNMCLKRQTEGSNFGSLRILVNGFTEILGELYHEDPSNIGRHELKAKYSNLNLKYKNTVINKKERTKASENSGNSIYKRGWMSNGIWNDLCIPNFEGMLKGLCIRYSSRAQLVSLFDVIQQLQRTKYREVLVHYLLYKVVPIVKIGLAPNSKEFSEAYKMCFTIIQILNPKSPVLVKTDN